jgi:hypothetical protein
MLEVGVAVDAAVVAAQAALEDPLWVAAIVQAASVGLPLVWTHMAEATTIRVQILEGRVRLAQQCQSFSLLL